MAYAVESLFPFFANLSGAPLNGGSVYFGTANANPETSPVTVYWDSALTQPAAQPISTLGGYMVRSGTPATVFASGDYSVTVKDKAGRVVYYLPSCAAITTDLSLQSQIDDLRADVDGGITIVTGNGVSDNSAAVLAANTAGRPILFLGVSVIGTPTEITVPIIDTMAQIFSASSQVTINNNSPVRPDWWGQGQNTVRYAINALPSTGGTVQLESKIYQPNGWVYGFGSSGTYISKANVTIQGRKMPRLNDDCRFLTGGSIIQGMVLAYADNFAMRDVGVDCGKNVVDTFYSGTTTAGITEALNCTYPDNATKTASPTKKGLALHNVIGLCASPSALNHAVIAGEGYDGVSCTGDLVGCYGLHGVVFKCSSVKADQISAYCNDGEGLIIKSDIQASAKAVDIQIGRVYARAQGPIGLSPYASALGTATYGICLHASGESIDKVQIDDVMLAGFPIGIGNIFGGSFSLASVNFGRVIIDQAGIAGTRNGVQIVAATGQFIERFRIETLEVRNSTVGANFAFVNPASLKNHASIGHLSVVTAANAIDISSASYVDIGTVSADDLSDAVYRITGTPKLTVGMLYVDSVTPAVYSAVTGGLVPALQNSWTNYGGTNDPFSIDLLGGRVNLRGLIKPGSSNQFATLPRWAWPATNKRFIAQAYNGTTQVAVPVLVSSAGVCNVNEAAGGYANCSTWLSLSGITYDTQA